MSPSWDGGRSNSPDEDLTAPATPRQGGCPLRVKRGPTALERRVQSPQSRRRRTAGTTRSSPAPRRGNYLRDITYGCLPSRRKVLHSLDEVPDRRRAHVCLSSRRKNSTLARRGPCPPSRRGPFLRTHEGFPNDSPVEGPFRLGRALPFPRGAHPQLAGPGYGLPCWRVPCPFAQRRSSPHARRADYSPAGRVRHSVAGEIIYLRTRRLSGVPTLRSWKRGIQGVNLLSYRIGWNSWRPYWTPRSPPSRGPFLLVIGEVFFRHCASRASRRLSRHYRWSRRCYYRARPHALRGWSGIPLRLDRRLLRHEAS